MNIHKKYQEEAGNTIEVKRLYLPFIVSDECPGCKKTIKIDLERSDYLSYPKLNEPFDFHIGCCDCNIEWSKQIKLTVNIEEV